MHKFVLPLFAVLLPAQAPAPQAPSTDLLALASRVETAHRPSGPVPQVTALKAAIELHMLDKKSEQRGQVDLLLDFLEWQRPGGKRVVPLLRYEVRDAGTPVVRGRDRDGPWQLVRGEARDLTSADATQDLAAFERHSNLVKQLLRFLSPGDVLRSLQQPGPIGDETLEVQRGTKVACQTVQGQLPAFPLLQQAGDDAPVELKVWIDKATGRLLAVDAWLLQDGKKDIARGERIVLGKLEVRDGLLVPLELLHLFREADGGLSLQSRAVMTKLSLRPELRAEDFDRK